MTNNYNLKQDDVNLLTDFIINTPRLTALAYREDWKALFDALYYNAESEIDASPNNSLQHLLHDYEFLWNYFKQDEVDFDILKHTEVIPSYAFYGSYFKNFEIPDNIKIIESNAFAANYDLISITIPNSIEVIGKEAFSSCSELKSLDLSKTKINILAEEVLAMCWQLKSIRLPDTLITVEKGALRDCEGLNSLFIPNSVRFIDNYAFFKCTNLTTIHLPKNLETLGNAFYKSNATINFYYPGTLTEWKSIEISDQCKSQFIKNSATLQLGDGTKILLADKSSW